MEQVERDAKRVEGDVERVEGDVEGLLEAHSASPRPVCFVVP